MERSTPSTWCRSLERCHPVKVVEVKKSFACSADLEIIEDHVSGLSSNQESIVLLCLLLFI